MDCAAGHRVCINGGIQRGFPVDRLQLAVFTQQRLRQALLWISVNTTCMASIGLEYCVGHSKGMMIRNYVRKHSSRCVIITAPCLRFLIFQIPDFHGLQTQPEFFK